MSLMLLGNAGIASVVATLLITFYSTGQSSIGWYYRVLILGFGILFLWRISSSRFFDRWFGRLITRALNYAFTTTPEAQFLVQGSFSGPTDLLETNRADLKIAYDLLIADFLNLTAAYGFSRETWASEPTDIHRVTLDLTLAPVDTASVVLGVTLEHRPYYLEWNIDVQLSIQMDLL